MRKKTSITIGLTIATILTAYMSTLTLSNQAFAALGVPPDTFPQVAAEKQFEKQFITQVTAEEQQVDKILQQEHLTPVEPLHP